MVVVDKQVNKCVKRCRLSCQSCAGFPVRLVLHLLAACPPPTGGVDRWWPANGVEHRGHMTPADLMFLHGSFVRQSRVGPRQRTLCPPSCLEKGGQRLMSLRAAANTADWLFKERWSGPIRHMTFKTVSMLLVLLSRGSEYPKDKTQYYNIFCKLDYRFPSTWWLYQNFNLNKYGIDRKYSHVRYDSPNSSPSSFLLWMTCISWSAAWLTVMKRGGS